MNRSGRSILFLATGVFPGTSSAFSRSGLSSFSYTSPILSRGYVRRPAIRADIQRDDDFRAREDRRNRPPGRFERSNYHRDEGGRRNDSQSSGRFREAFTPRNGMKDSHGAPWRNRRDSSRSRGRFSEDREAGRRNGEYKFGQPPRRMDDEFEYGGVRENENSSYSRGSWDRERDPGDVGYAPKRRMSEDRPRYRDRGYGDYQRSGSNRFETRNEEGRRDGNSWNQRSASEPPTEIQKALASGDDLLYGIRPVHMALMAGRRDCYTLHVLPDGKKTGPARKQDNMRLFTEIIHQAQALGIKVVERDRGDLNVLAGYRAHQGVILQCSPLEYVSLKELDKGVTGDVWVVLDEVRDPQNAGALMRSCYFLGAKGFAVTHKNSACLSPVVSKASAGAVEIMEVFGVDSLPRFLRGATEKGWRVLGAASEKDAVDLRSVEIGPPTVLVLGAEGSGLRTMVRSCCTNLVSINPSKNCTQQVDSLNVSVAGGLAMYHLLGQ